MFPINRHPSTRDLRGFGWAMLIGFGIIGAILWISATLNTESGLLSWSGNTGQIVAVALWAVGVTVFALSILTPESARPVYVAWMMAASALGLVMSTLLLSILYFALLPVFALIVRWRNRRDAKSEPSTTHWWPHSPMAPTMERMKRMF